MNASQSMYLLYTLLAAQKPNKPKVLVSNFYSGVAADPDTAQASMQVGEPEIMEGRIIKVEDTAAITLLSEVDAQYPIKPRADDVGLATMSVGVVASYLRKGTAADTGAATIQINLQAWDGVYFRNLEDTGAATMTVGVIKL